MPGSKEIIVVDFAENPYVNIALRGASESLGMDLRTFEWPAVAYKNARVTSGRLAAIVESRKQQQRQVISRREHVKSVVRGYFSGPNAAESSAQTYLAKQRELPHLYQLARDHQIPYLVLNPVEPEVAILPQDDKASEFTYHPNNKTLDLEIASWIGAQIGSEAGAQLSVVPDQA